VEDVALEASELVFVGHGVDAPELGWDDFKGVDLSGKTLVMLIGDPPVPDPADPLRLDKKTFGGTAMTYYGRWTYKMDIAAARKAAGVLIVHETAAAGYAFSVVQAQLGERFHLRTPDRNLARPAVEGWMTQEEGRALFKLAGQDFEALQRQAATRAFKPVPLGITASTTIRNALRPIDSRNVIGRIEGSDARRRQECVVFTAHWDHFGTGPAIEGETVRHGAVDNATGVAGLLELARVFARLPVKPKRSLLFLAVTAEEQNLLGSEYYVRQPVIPLDRTLAVLNLEMMNVYGRTGDLIVYGLGESQLDDYLREAAAEQNRSLRPDPVAEQGLFFRSDHFSFVKQGVPAVWASGGEHYLDKPADFGRRVRDEYLANRYHKPADKPRPEWDLAGALQDLQVYAAAAFRIAETDKFPQWATDSAIRAAREQMFKSSKP
jgi:Zn-dependent M28 family amino/carboxypeptidase